MKSNFVTYKVVTTTILAISALSCLSIFGLDQPALAQRLLNQECARFFKGTNGRGPSFSVCNTNSDGVPNGFNDQISSINIPEDRKCILFTDARFRGASKEFRGPTRVNLGPFNNKVSSIQCTVR